MVYHYHHHHPPTATDEHLRPLSSYQSTSVSMAAATESKTETDIPKNGLETKTVEVSNVSKAITERDIWEFFSFSGNIHYIEMKSESETTQHAFVTFKEQKGANTALLLTGATIGDLSVTLSPVENYQLPAGAPPLTSTETDRTHEVAEKAEEVVSTMLAKGFVLGKDALQKAKSFDEKHQLTSNASATVASIDSKMGLTEKLSTGTAAVNEKMKEVDERYKVSEATKSAMVAAEQKANNAGSALMSNKYVASGAVWIAGAFAAVTKAAEDVGSKTKEKVDKAEEEKEGSKAKEKVHEVKEENEGSKSTTEKVHEAKEENEGSKTTEKVHEPAEEKEGSKTNENAKKAEEGSNKDSPVTPVKSSNDNSELPKH